MKVGFVGAGKVGCSLAMHFALNGVSVSGFYSRSNQSAAAAADFVKSNYFSNLETLIEESDVIFITVPDDEIIHVWEQLKPMSIVGKWICHCSGLLSSKIFSGIENTGAFGFSVHPLLAVSDRYTSYQEIPNALFTIEGQKERIGQMKDWLTDSGLKVILIDESQKPRYHSAAVMCSNLVVALIRAAENELLACGFSQEQLQDAIAPLLLGNVKKILQVGTLKALTGPIERNDLGTVSRHLEVLEGQDRDAYISLSRIALSLAREKHTDCDYESMELLLNNREEF